MRRFYSLLIILICFITFSALTFPQALSEGTYSGIGTADGLDGSADAINFSQGRVWTIDQYGKYIWLTEGRDPQEHHWTWSNDLGATWEQGAQNYAALNRGSVAYDSNNDKLHVIWTGDANSDGIIYRRYGLTRDGSNNITAITREDSANINLQLDTSASRTLSSPVALWVDDGSTNGILVAVWTKTGTSLTEIRASMRRLSLSAADGVAGNWVALDGTGDTFSTDPPAVAADKVYGSTSTGEIFASAKVRGGSGARKDDIYIFGSEDVSPVSRLLAYRGVWDSVDKDWSGGFQSPVTVGQVNNGAGGYSLKFQLITKPVIDETNDRLYIGWARWKTGGDGDTVSFAYLDSTDTASSVFDAYASLGTHSYAPTLDIAFDDTRDEFYISYVESTTNGTNGSIDYKVFDGTTLGTQTRFYTNSTGTAGEDGSADIPILYESRSSNDRLLFAFRINGQLPPTLADPHTIDWGYITLAAAPTPTPSSSSSSQSPTVHGITSSTEPPACTDSAPNGIPDLFQIDTAGTFVNLHFTTVANSTTGYQISYGIEKNDSLYGDSFGFDGKEWITNRVVGGLTTNTNYSFKIKAVNGCNAGAWSKTVQIKTKGKFADLTSALSKLNPFAKQPTPKTTTTSTPTSCEYIVQPGDSMWLIAQKVLGSGKNFAQLKDLNKDLASFDLIRIGLKIKVC